MTASGPKSSAEEHVYVLGHTPYKQFLDFMTTEPIDAPMMDRKVLGDEWRAANEYMATLQQSEPDWADNPPVTSLPAGMEGLLAQVLADPIYLRAFSAVPAEIRVVELDRLIVRQKQINLAHVQRLKAEFGYTPSPESVFRICLPFDHPMPDYRVGYVGDNTFVFTSVSNDIRFLDGLALRPDQVRDYQASGPIAGVVALVVGFGSNFLNAISAEGRLVLNNGSHRAYALRDLGITHVPCVIQKVTHRDELNVVGAGALKRTPDLYLKGPRPPVLRDYFDPRLRKIVRLAPKARHVRVRYTIDTFDVPDNR